MTSTLDQIVGECLATFEDNLATVSANFGKGGVGPRSKLQIFWGLIAVIFQKSRRAKRILVFEFSKRWQWVFTLVYPTCCEIFRTPLGQQNLERLREG